ncbi:hypothetical protein BVC80_1713g41 [Macleaya cordata]|uniref:Reverse transcriptase zinc-binding domain n=1 Tax=Macleaya cordata TaxID=56857 RepID=A0A200Q2B4_MACCD|nr:hypothetical protein BVC80_1713g41 [Macleaya cordata]
MHLLVECQFSRAVWFASSLGIHSHQIDFSSFLDWFPNWFKPQSQLNIPKETWPTILAVSCWLIWKERCKRVFENTKPHPLNTCNQILEFLNCLHNPPKSRNISNLNISYALTWSPPPRNTIKINVDGSFKTPNEFSGIGMLARNHSLEDDQDAAEQNQHPSPKA